MRIFSCRSPQRAAAVVAVAALVAALPSVGAVQARAGAVVSPALVASVRVAPVPAVVAWDPTRTSDADAVARLRAAGLDVAVLDRLHMAVACSADARAVRVMASLPGAVSVWGDEELTPQLDKSVRTAFNGDPRAVWDTLGVTGAGVGVAVVDTGVDGRHPDVALGDRTKRNVRVVLSHREVLGAGDPPPCQDVYTAEEMEDSEGTSGHGTHMAGVAAGDGTASGGRYRGVAPGAEIMGVAVADSVTVNADVTAGVKFSMLGALAGFNYVLTNGLEVPMRVKAVLAPWTGKGLHDPFHPIYLAARNMYDFGIVTVFPAGNGGSGTSDCSAAATCTFNPFAVGPYSIGVGATAKTSRTAVEPYSSRGDPMEREARGEVFRYEPMLVAPGTDVVAARRLGLSNVGTPPSSIAGAGGSATADQTDRHHIALTGTSVAAAHVAGAVALVQEAALKGSGCFLYPQEVVDLLRSTATAVPGAARWEAGAGAIDVTAAVKAALAHEPSPTVDPWMCAPFPEA